METTIKKPNLSFPKIIGDLALASVAVSIIAVTYIGLQRLTPQSATYINAQKNSNVLGANTSQKHLQYIPTNNAPAFISESSFETGINSGGVSIATFKLKSLENIPYEFTPLTLKNSSNTFSKVRISPEFSVQGSYASIEIIYDGLTFEMISSTGTVNPVEISVPGQSTTSLMLRITPIVRLAAPSTLTMDFTEVP